MDLLITDNQCGEIHETKFSSTEIDAVLSHLKNLLINTESDALINIHITKTLSKH